MSKAVFLDRDGTINVDKGYVHCAEDFIFLPGAIEGLRLLSESGFLLIIITNQSGIARGFYTEREYQDFQIWVNDRLEDCGIHITETYYCPHCSEDRCCCRKPKLELYERAAEKYNIDWSKSYAIGDRERDLAVCAKYPVKGFLIGAKESETIQVQGVDSLLDAAKFICAVNKNARKWEPWK